MKTDKKFPRLMIEVYTGKNSKLLVNEYYDGKFDDNSIADFLDKISDRLRKRSK